MPPNSHVMLGWSISIALLLSLFLTVGWPHGTQAGAGVHVPPMPLARYGHTDRPQVISIRALPAAPSSAHPQSNIAFHPPDQAAFDAAKVAAQQGGTGRQAGVVNLVPSPASGGPVAMQISGEAVLAAFPATSFRQEQALVGEVAPPDTQIAAGPAYLLEMVNTTASFWIKSGSLVRVVDLNAFFGVPTCLLYTSPSPRD